MKSSYLSLYKSGELQKRVHETGKILKRCTICPHECGTDRLSGEKGICATGAEAMVSSYSPHFGEEEPLVGTNGSGTIFFSHCNLACVFCQNYDISHCGDEHGEKLSSMELADLMLRLQEKGCHNINFVTPSHVVPQILEALLLAVEKGLTVPLVYNSSGYDSLETLRLLDGIVDIYMPDFKFWKSESAKMYTNAADYPEIARQAVKEMHSQVGDLRINEEDIAEKGLLIRHLVMPEGVDESKEILNFIVTQISADTYINIMDQYRPAGKAASITSLGRSLMPDEHQEVTRYAKKIGLNRLDEKDMVSFLRKLGLFK